MSFNTELTKQLGLSMEDVTLNLTNNWTYQWKMSFNTELTKQLDLSMEMSFYTELTKKLLSMEDV